MNTDIERSQVIVKCTDNCSCMSIDKFPDEEEYYVTIYKSFQGTSFWHRVKTAIKCLRGHKIVDTDIVLSESEYQRLRDFK